MSKRKRGYWGFIGFMGFYALNYLTTHNILDLCYIAYFGFFGYFLTDKISVDIPDERYHENIKLATAFIGNIALFEMGIMFACGIFFSAIRENMIVFVSACFASLVIAYSIKFYTLEQR
ncbi:MULTISPECIES: DUF3796 domain-containing protein [Clostridium]|uniref:DUF3796 domain-containing protein n=2 Tax=Clostridium TaxID=1485 RepID=A0A0E3GQ26_CLOSL|nr:MULTISPECIES: DUF3796 domain-containing protein [Clostridium]AKA67836.1 hypothetical protein CSCA_0711 [Clostridium scatologenes]AWI05748.1 hypothetical protein B9W14_14990 [Clostridium drakei]